MSFELRIDPFDAMIMRTSLPVASTALLYGFGHGFLTEASVRSGRSADNRKHAALHPLLVQPLLP